MVIKLRLSPIMLENFQIQRLNPNTLYDPTPYAYTHLTHIKISEVSEIIHISGQGGENSQGELTTDFTVQCQNTFHNLKLALQASNITWHNIARMTVLIVQHNTEKHHILIQMMQQYFPTQQFPACTLIPVPCLALPHMQIEIDATAYRFHDTP